MTKRDAQRVLGDFVRSGINLATDRATVWLANHLSKIRGTMRQESYIDSKETIIRKDARPGHMFFFGYLPKTKEHLNFWDEFPIVVVLHPQRGGFLGLNLHYLPPRSRALFLNKLLKYVDDPKFLSNQNIGTRIRLTYAILKASSGGQSSPGSLAEYRKCIKSYRYSHIRTKIALIRPQEWKSVPFFPLDRFKGESRESVWRLIR